MRNSYEGGLRTHSHTLRTLILKRYVDRRTMKVPKLASNRFRFTQDCT